jgi:hypothetical protein
MSLAIYNAAAFINAAGVANIGANPTIEVRRMSDNGLAAIYSDEAGTLLIVNPSAFGDANGRFQFYAAGISRGYRVKVTVGADVYQVDNQRIGTAGDMDAHSFWASVWSAGTQAAARLALGFAALAAKGSIWAASAADTVAALAVGANGTALIADSAEATGLRWGTLPAITVRQTVRLSAVDANGLPSFLGAGAGLNFNIDASPSELVMDFAAGNVDLTATVSADASNQGTLDASNTNFVYADYATPITVTWSDCLIPPQYGYAFDRRANVLLRFNGTDASTSIIDDFGNTWAAVGNAQLDTAQFKHGSASLLLDGTGDYIVSTEITSLGDGSWELSCWFRINALPGSGSRGSLIFFSNAAGRGARCVLFNNAGTTRMEMSLSSDGSSNNIVDGGVGSNTTWTLNQWNRVRLVFDALAGTYRVYLSLNGAAETQDQSVSSTARICALTTARFGVDHSAANGFNGWIDSARLVHAATVTGTQTPSGSEPTITDFPVHFFSIPEMKMYEVTAASASAGVNPTLTARNRLFVGEVDTNGSAVTAARNYALRGLYIGTPIAYTASTPIAFNHNIGTNIVEAITRGTPHDNSVAVATPGFYHPWSAFYFNGSTNETRAFSTGTVRRCTAFLYPGATNASIVGDDGNLAQAMLLQSTVRRLF